LKVATESIHTRQTFWDWAWLFIKFSFFACPWIDDARFDASQYQFFGKDILEDVELGGLEDQVDEIAPALCDYDFQFSTGDEGLVRCLY
jgi:hypothetical protein